MMTSVTSDESPSARNPTAQRSKSGSQSTNSRYTQELPTRDGYNDLKREDSPGIIHRSDDQSRSAYIQGLQRTIDALRAQLGAHRDHVAQREKSDFSSEGDRRNQIAHSGEDRVHSRRFQNGEELERGWKKEIKRWKRVSNRNGFSDIYDESEKIEDIRRREREIRSGGTTPLY